MKQTLQRVLIFIIAFVLVGETLRWYGNKRCRTQGGVVLVTSTQRVCLTGSGQ